MKYSKSILLTLLYSISTEIIALWIFLIPNKLEHINLIEASHFINSLITLILLIVFFILIRKAYLLKFRKAKFRYYLLAPILGIGFVFFQPFLDVIYYQEISIDLFKFDFTLDRLTFLSVGASILIVPFIEEFFFRGYIQVGLTKHYKPFKAIMVTSILFAFMHFNIFFLLLEFMGFMGFVETIRHMGFNIHQVYIVFFGGLISGILFYKCKSITPSIIFHVFWNLAAYVL
jgi:membrane protease YdiL (CAAX protease family)